MTQNNFIRRNGRRRVRIAAVALALTGVGIGATAGVAGAHTPVITHFCDTGLSVTLTFYDPPASNNLLTVTIDGVTTTFPFAAGFSQTFPWDPLADHTYTVVIDANRSPGNPLPTKFDRTFSGSQERCPDLSSTTTTAPPAESTTTTSAITTTTAPPADSTTTTIEAATTTTAAATTTTIVGSGGPPAPTTTAVAVGPPTVGGSGGLQAPTGSRLPATGNDTGMQLTVALALLIGGLVLFILTRKRVGDTGHDD
jgi:LPXTG-motif cell wall-anchored protein